MQADGKNTKATMPATTSKDATIKSLETVQQHLYAILGLKMALDKLKSLGYDVVAECGTDGNATIKANLKIQMDFDSGTMNGKDVVASLDALNKQIKELRGKDEK